MLSPDNYRGLCRKEMSLTPLSFPMSPGGYAQDKHKSKDLFLALIKPEHLEFNSRQVPNFPESEVPHALVPRKLKDVTTRKMSATLGRHRCSHSCLIFRDYFTEHP